MDAPPRLAVELIPQSAWGVNFRNAEPELWRQVRKRVIREALGRCKICRYKPGSFLHVHEVWSYDDRNCILKLVEFRPLCHSCHEVVHMGRTQATGGVKAVEQALVWLCRINNWTISEGERHVQQAFKLWEWRTKSPWTVDISYGYEFLKEEPA